MNWDLYRIFSVVCDTHTLKNAGITLGMSGATVGRKISELEHGLGVELFIKAPSGYQLTTAGEALASKLADDLQTLADLDEKARKATKIEKETIEINTIESLSVNWLPRVLSGYLANTTANNISIKSEYKLLDPRQSSADIILRLGDKAPKDLTGVCIDHFGFRLFSPPKPKYQIIYSERIGATRFGIIANNNRSSNLPDIVCGSIAQALKIATQLPVQLWLPEFLGDENGLERHPDDSKTFSDKLWVLRRPLERKEQHIRPIFKLIVEAAKRDFAAST